MKIPANPAKAASAPNPGAGVGDVVVVTGDGVVGKGDGVALGVVV